MAMATPVRALRMCSVSYDIEGMLYFFLNMFYANDTEFELLLAFGFLYYGGTGIRDPHWLRGASKKNNARKLYGGGYLRMSNRVAVLQFDRVARTGMEFFDFAYMRKPVLYYQFDEEEFRANHYAKGYFDYRRDGFGEVVTEEEKALDLLEQYLENGCRLKPAYRARIQEFFPLHDQNNCERIYHEIMKL